MFRICNKKRTKGPTLVQVVDIHQNVVTMDEMTMAQYKIIHSYNTMVTANFQQKFNIGGKIYDRIIVIW